jgi:hypothetical protein
MTASAGRNAELRRRPGSAGHPGETSIGGATTSAYRWPGGRLGDHRSGRASAAARDGTTGPQEGRRAVGEVPEVTSVDHGHGLACHDLPAGAVGEHLAGKTLGDVSTSERHDAPGPPARWSTPTLSRARQLNGGIGLRTPDSAAEGLASSVMQTPQGRRSGARRRLRGHLTRAPHSVGSLIATRLLSNAERNAAT